MAPDEAPIPCPRCGAPIVLAFAEVPLIVVAVPASREEGVAIGRPFGSTFPMPRNAPVACNGSACGWRGKVKDLRRPLATEDRGV